MYMMKLQAAPNMRNSGIEEKENIGMNCIQVYFTLRQGMLVQ